MLELTERLNVILLKKRPMRKVRLIADAPTGRIAILKQYGSGAPAVREYQALDACSGDPHIVRLLDFFETKGQWCLLTEYVSGDTLSDLVERRGTFEPEKVADLAIDILTGIKQVHDSGYIHADLHARNVIVTDFDNAKTKIIDFQHSVRKLASGKAKAIRKRGWHCLAPRPRPASSTNVSTSLGSDTCAPIC